MNKHTEGPWRYSEVMNFSGTLVSYIMSENSQIAQTRGSDEEHTEEEITANAALLAAAPELLEAVKCCLADLEGAIELMGYEVPSCWYESIKEARVAIAKAEGRA